MLRNPPRIALVLLASFAGLLLAGVVARAEPAASASPSADADCLAKPNAPSASGNHWYYRLDRATGRRCWYQRPTSGAANEAAQSRPATHAPVAPVDKPVPDAPADRLSAPLEQNAVEPAAAAPAQSSWSTATPAPVPPAQIAPAANDIASPAPVDAAQSDAVVAPPRLAPAAAAPVRQAIGEPPAAVAADDTHMPALFGAAVALFVIVVGSIVARLVAKLVRSRRHRDVAPVAAASAPPPVLPAQDTPALVPPMPREDDITHAAPPPWMTRRAPAARPDAAPAAAGAAPPDRDSARELEDNVRALLHRMRGESQRIPEVSAAPQPRSPDEFDELLAAWRSGRRRRTSG
jgi:hypothetical protein